MTLTIFNWTELIGHLPIYGTLAVLLLWAPGAEMAGFMKIDCSKAKEHGLSFRPLAETARDTYVWANARPPGYRMQSGWDADREAQVLAKWKARKPATTPSS